MKKYFALLATVILITSCEKGWLDVKGDSKQLVPSTLDDFQALIDDVQRMNINEMEKGEIASDGHFVTDINYTNEPLDERKDAYTWSKSTRHLGEAGKPWHTVYKKILTCNIVLDGLNRMSAGDKADVGKYNFVKTQALFQRAFTFLQIAQLYTPIPTAANSNEKLGVVLRLTTDINEKSVRSTIGETYNQIIKDLTEAINIAPAGRAAILSRASKPACLALLARTYLILGDYPNALKLAKEELAMYSKLMDFNNLDQSKLYVGLYNEEVLFHSNLKSSSFTTRNCLIDQELYESFEEDDLRKVVFFRQVATGIAFKGNYNNSTSLLFNGMATDEVFLTAAECNARLGNLDAAMKDLNILLKSRWRETAVFVPKAASTKEEAVQIILKERKKELMLRGVRWMDLRRLSNDPQHKVTVTRVVNGSTFTLPPNSFKYAFPIPDDVVEQTGIPQNPGWE